MAKSVDDITGEQAAADLAKLTLAARDILRIMTPRPAVGSYSSGDLWAVTKASVAETQAALAELSALGIIDAHVNNEHVIKLTTYRYSLSNWGFFVAKALTKVEGEPGRSSP